MPSSKFLVVLVTCKDKKEARTLATGLVKKKLAACVNILPGIESIFSWKGKIEKASEVLLIIKTQQNTLPILEKLIKTNHSYDCPEIIALSISKGSKDYLDWLGSNIRSSTTRQK